MSIGGFYHSSLWRSVFFAHRRRDVVHVKVVPLGKAPYIPGLIQKLHDLELALLGEELVLLRYAVRQCNGELSPAEKVELAHRKTVYLAIGVLKEHGELTGEIFSVNPDGNGLAEFLYGKGFRRGDGKGVALFSEYLHAEVFLGIADRRRELVPYG